MSKTASRASGSLPPASNSSCRSSASFPITSNIRRTRSLSSSDSANVSTSGKTDFGTRHSRRSPAQGTTRAAPHAPHHVFRDEAEHTLHVAAPEALEHRADDLFVVAFAHVAPFFGACAGLAGGAFFSLISP